MLNKVTQEQWDYYWLHQYDYLEGYDWLYDGISFYYYDIQGMLIGAYLRYDKKVLFLKHVPAVYPAV